MTDAERPYRLEVWELDPDACEETWRKWSTYISYENAAERRDKLISKGHSSRVVNTTSGEVFGLESAVECPWCSEVHGGVKDGGCLV